MKNGFLPLLVLGIWSGCMSGGRNPEVAMLSALEFSSASSVEFAGLKGESQAKDAFHGYQRVTAWHSPDAAVTAEVATLMAGMIRGDLTLAREGGLRLDTFCFNPGYAVRLKSNRGTREFLVCLDCEKMYVFDDAGHVWNHRLEKGELVKLATLLGGA